MKEAEIRNTSLRVQYWLVRIKESEDRLQQCKGPDEAVREINRLLPAKKWLSPLDEQCFRHAVEVCPIRCPLTEQYFK